MPGFCDVKNDTKINNFTTFSIFILTYNLSNAIEKQTWTVEAGKLKSKII